MQVAFYKLDWLDGLHKKFPKHKCYHTYCAVDPGLLNYATGATAEIAALSPFIKPSLVLEWE